MKFEDVSGQSFTIDILKEQLKTKRIRNGYLFSGASGCGKTTIARIFGRELNNGSDNITELDAASNNSVEDVRNLIKDANYKAIGTDYKIYIIDECHSISSQGWQAFLKTLEEPPTSSVFIFCTTEPQKIPLTIQNRLQHFVFTRMETDTIKKRLKYIIDMESLSDNFDDDAIEYIAKTAHGGMRDGITNLDKCASMKSGKLNTIDIANILSIADYNGLFSIIKNLNDKSKVLDIIDNLYNSGIDLKILINDLIKLIIDLLKSSLIGAEKTDIPSGYYNDIKDLNIKENKELYQNLLYELMKLKSNINYETYCKPFVEAFFIQFNIG